MFDPLLATGLGINADGAAALVIKGLAVGGGFLVGYFLGTVVAWALDRWIFAHKAPPQLKKMVALVAGVGLAVLVALIIFGEGGKGIFGDRGTDGENKGSPDPKDGKQAPVPPDTPKDPPPKEPPLIKPKDPSPKPTPGDVRVAILGGEDVKDGRFYQIDDDMNPKTFEEFKQAITARRVASKSEITIIFRFKKEPLSENHPAVRQAVAWVNESKLLNRFE